MLILVTGGAGYIGSHTCLELLRKGYNVVVVDNLSNSSKESLERVKKLAARDLTFYEFNVEDKEKLREVFKGEKIEAVVHFAGLKAVGESVRKPLSYYYNNLVSTLVLCEVMTEFHVKKLVFSSSATVYGNPHAVPIKEDFPLTATNPYGRTKLMQEEMLRDLTIADSEWKIILLRYFNPIGADKSGMIGEDPLGIPNNLVPYITQVAVGKLKELQVYGDDYDTKDGSGVRDYIHVTDLAIGHVKSIELLDKMEGIKTYNLGTGMGYSVFEMIAAFSEVCRKPIPYVVKARRPGDIAACYADPSLGKEELGFSAERELAQMCEDAYRWQFNNPNGYRSVSKAH
jgi:UDP-glucose 4-epimerase